MRGQEPDCQADVAPQHPRPARLQATRCAVHQAGGSGPESLAATVYDRQTKSGVGDRYYVYSDLRRVAVPGSGDGSRFTADHRLVHEADVGQGNRAGRLVDGGVAPPAQAGRHHSLGSGVTVQ